MEETFKHIDEHKLIAIIRMSDPSDAQEVTKAVIAGGFRIIEYSMINPQAPRLIESIASKNGTLVGAGAVTDGEIAQRAINAGAKFIKTPYLDQSILTVGKNNNVFVIQSAATTTEVMTAFQAGVDLINLYPVDLLGGPNFFKRLKKALPISQLMVSGGITCDNVLDYLRVSTTAVAIGNAICDQSLIRTHNWQEVTDRAKKFQQKLEFLKVTR